jgi:AraC-like DNA-binding protein
MSKRKHVLRSNCQGSPTSLAVAMLEGVAAIGRAPDAILKDAGCLYGLRELKDANADLSIKAFTSVNRACNAILREYIELTNSGCSLNEEQFSLLCRCVLCSQDLGDAIRTTSSFFAMFDGRIGKIELDCIGTSAVLKVSPHRRQLTGASFLVDVFGIAVLHMLYEWLTGQRLELERLQLTYPKSSEGAFPAALFDCPIRFDATTNAIWFAKECLSRPVVRTRSDLADLLVTFPFDMMLQGEHRRPLSEHIYITMMNAYVRTRRMPTVDEVARLFGMSSWTLRRRLAEDDTGYFKIRRKCQLNLATEFLRRGELTIDEVADIANFSDAGAFRRAFQQWTGRSPSAYREAVLHN